MPETHFATKNRIIKPAHYVIELQRDARGWTGSIATSLDRDEEDADAGYYVSLAGKETPQQVLSAIIECFNMEEKETDDQW